MRDKRGDLAGDAKRVRSQSPHSTEAAIAVRGTESKNRAEGRQGRKGRDTSDRLRLESGYVKTENRNDRIDSANNG